jgi:hypothetical protein
MLPVAQRSDRRRQMALPFLASEDNLLGAFVALDDHSGLVAAAGLVGGFLGALLMNKLRPTKSYTVAVTGSSVLMIRNGVRGWPKTVELVHQSVAVFGPVEGPMDCTVTIGVESYTIPFQCAVEAKNVICLYRTSVQP